MNIPIKSLIVVRCCQLPPAGPRRTGHRCEAPNQTIWTWVMKAAENEAFEHPQLENIYCGMLKCLKKLVGVIFGSMPIYAYILVDICWHINWSSVFCFLQYSRIWPTKLENIQWYYYIILYMYVYIYILLWDVCVYVYKYIYIYI